jgi:transcription elongation factor GreA
VKRNHVPMTPSGFKDLQKELKHLKSVERPRIVADIEEARAHGDLSENAEYHAAKEKQALITKRIGEVQNMIVQAEVIDPSKIEQSKIVFGATVKLSDIDTDETVSYQIVGEDESDVLEIKYQ